MQFLSLSIHWLCIVKRIRDIATIDGAQMAIKVRKGTGSFDVLKIYLCENFRLAPDKKSHESIEWDWLEAVSGLLASRFAAWKSAMTRDDL